MANSLAIPYDWLKNLDASIITNDSIPIAGHLPVFPWDQLTAILSKSLECPDLSIKSGALAWRNQDALLEGMGPASLLKFSVPPLTGYAYWAMAHGDILSLMNMLFKHDHPTERIVNPEFLQGFYHFIAAEAIRTFKKVDFDSNLIPHLIEESDVPSEVALCQDVHLSVGDQTVIARWIMPPAFHRSLHERYAERTMATTLNNILAESVKVTVALEAGKTTLSYEEVSSLQPGDFITLDVCHYEYDDKKAKVNLTINGHQLFRARFKQHELKILELPLYQEAETHMDKNFPHDPSQPHGEDEESDSFFDNEEENEDDDFTFDEDLNIDENQFEEKLYGEEEPHQPPQAEGQSPEPISQPSPSKKAVEAEAPKEKKPFSVAELPVEITIEAGRIKLPIHKLLDLQPGNVLELNIKPEDGVNLVVNGKCIGKGEFLRVGEVLGVRILDLGG